MTATAAVPTAFAADSPPVYLNGRPLAMTTPPVLVQDRVLVPVRSYMEALGADVYWQPPDSITVQWEDRTVALKLGAKTARVGTNTLSLDVPAQLIDSRTYVPLRFLSEGLGADVAYDGSSVRVTSPIGSRVVYDGPLNVRSAPDLTAPVLESVPVGTRFSVLAENGDWTQVSLPRDRTGWIATRYTEPPAKRPPFDPLADALAGPTGYLEVQGQCLGAVPSRSEHLYAPLAPTVAALGGTVNGSTVSLRGRTWQADAADLWQIGDETFLPLRTLASALGLDVGFDFARQTAGLTAPGAAAGSGAQGCNPAVPFGSYVIMDARSGLVLAEQQADQPRQVASITKIMTGLLAVERANPNTVITASRNAASQVCTCMGLRTGDQIKLSDMLYGLMLPSGNDAAVAIAEALSGSETAFAGLMNQRAAQLGATNTHFLNASGLDDWVRPYSTAHDMAVIGRAAMQNPDFRAVVSRTKYQFSGPRGTWALTNHNDFVGSYSGATGVKNGWTELAGSTLVASAYRDGEEVIVVILGAPVREQMFAQAQQLMDQGFRLAPAAWPLHR